jgi:hypothetical protein
VYEGLLRNRHAAQSIAPAIAAWRAHDTCASFVSALPR